MARLKDFIMTDKTLNFLNRESLKEKFTYPFVLCLSQINNSTKEYLNKYFSEDKSSRAFLYFNEQRSTLRIEDSNIVKGDYFDGYELTGIYFVVNEIDLNSILAQDLEGIRPTPIPKFSETKKQRALFLDRDGVINVNTHYPHVASELQLIEDIIPIAKHFYERGYLIIVTTNQSGIGRGYFKEEAYFECRDRINQFFSDQGLKITDHFHCPYHKSGVDEYAKDSLLRKPEPGMFLKAASKYQIEIEQSIMIGDRPSDVIKDISLKSFIIGEESSDGLNHHNFLEKLKETF